MDKKLLAGRGRITSLLLLVFFFFVNRKTNSQNTILANSVLGGWA